MGQAQDGAGARGCPLLENRHESRQHFVNDLLRRAFDFSGAAGGQVERARLVAAHDAGRLQARARGTAGIRG